MIRLLAPWGPVRLTTTRFSPAAWTRRTIAWTVSACERAIGWSLAPAAMGGIELVLHSYAALARETPDSPPNGEESPFWSGLSPFALVGPSWEDTSNRLRDDRAGELRKLSEAMIGKFGGDAPDEALGYDPAELRKVLESSTDVRVVRTGRGGYGRRRLGCF
jgi:hypothetical protein